MVMSWIWTGIVLISILCALVLGNGSALAAATVSGAQAGIQLALSMAGSLCLWTGAGRLMEHAGITRMLSRLLRPLLHRVFPSTQAAVTPSPAEQKLVTHTAGRMSKGVPQPRAPRTAATFAGISWMEAVFSTIRRQSSSVAVPPRFIRCAA